MRVISLFLIAKIREGILFYVHQCNDIKKLHQTMDQASVRGFYLSHTDLQLSQMNRYQRAKSNTLLSSFHENNTHLQLFIHAQVIGDHSVTTRSLLVDSGSWIFATRSVVPLAKKGISSSSFIFHKRKQTIKQTYKSGLLIGQE